MTFIQLASGRPRDEMLTPRLVRLPDSDVTIVRALRERDRAGAGLLFDRYYGHVRRVLTHVLGPDAELPDLVQEVFLAAVASIGGLREPTALKSWIASIAVHVARKRIRHRRRLRLFDLFPSDEPPERIDPRAPEPELEEAVRATYRVLDALSTEDRVVFALRYIDGQELTELATLCGASISTIKRRLARATQRFAKHARREPSLAEFLEGAPWLR